MTKIKICGITNTLDAIKAVELGADMLGFVFYKKSKRYIEPRVARDIINELPPYVGTVGVFVDEDRPRVSEVAQEAMFNMVQFHGDETPDYCAAFKDRYKVIKAFRLKDRKSLSNINTFDTDYYLLDTYKGETVGGTGETFDWSIIEDFEFLRPVILSGGLTPQNVAKAIKKTAPYAVDVSTGVEVIPGKKDHKLMEKFIFNVRKAER